MDLLKRFHEADKKVTEIEKNGGLLLGDGYAEVESTKEYDIALNEAQKLYNQLQERGIDPFVI